MLKFFLYLFIFILLFLYFLVNVNSELYYFNIKITLLCLIFSILIHLFYSKSKFISKKINKGFKYLNPLIDKYLIYLLLSIFFVLINYITFSKHLNFYSSGFDLGIFDQVIYKYSNLEFPASSSIRNISNIEADHFHPILILYAIVYKIYASPLVLIFLQNLFFVLGGLGIYKVSKLKLNIPIIGFLLVFLYLIFKGNINALLFDFHPLVIAVSLFPWLFYFSIKKEWLKYFLLVIPILLTKENLSIYIIFFGIYQFFIQKEKKIGLISFFIGIVYFQLVMNYFLPAMGGGGKYWSYDLLGNNPKELIINTFLHPIEFLIILFGSITKITTYLHHLGSGLYIAIFSPLIILLIPSYAQKFLSSREEFWTMNFHYSIDIFWIIAIGIIYTLYFIRIKYKKKHKKIFIILIIFIFLNSFIINIHKSPLLYSRYNLENRETLNEIITTLPREVKLSTQNKIVPHFSHNSDIYIFPNLGNSEYILLNKKINSAWPMTREKNLDYYIKKLDNKENFNNVELPFIKDSLNFTRKYDLIIKKDEIYLYKLVSIN